MWGGIARALYGKRVACCALIGNCATFLCRASGRRNDGIWSTPFTLRQCFVHPVLLESQHRTYSHVIYNPTMHMIGQFSYSPLDSASRRPEAPRPFLCEPDNAFPAINVTGWISKKENLDDAYTSATGTRLDFIDCSTRDIIVFSWPAIRFDDYSVCKRPLVAKALQIRGYNEQERSEEERGIISDRSWLWRDLGLRERR